jgi:hypothetical protein
VAYENIVALELNIFKDNIQKLFTIHKFEKVGVSSYHREKMMSSRNFYSLFNENFRSTIDYLKEHNLLDSTSNTDFTSGIFCKNYYNFLLRTRTMPEILKSIRRGTLNNIKESYKF